MKNALFISFFLALLSCGSDSQIPTGRTYRMGFANSAPRFDDINLLLQSLNLWSTRADAAIINTEVPWDEMFAGTNPATYVVDNYSGLAEFYKSKNMKLWVYVDPQNGLDRSADAVELVAMGKSIAEDDVQTIYRRFVVVMDSILHPDHLGLALETNLIRDAASPAIYQGVKKAVNDVVAELTQRSSPAKRSVSVQVDHAWGKLGGGIYQGIAQDLSDFPFVEELGLSSYPYFGWSNPEEIPTNYYSKLVNGTNLPVFVSEGGWSSASVTTATTSFVSSPQIQEQYVRHHRKLLDEAHTIAVFQLVFTDIDESSLPPNAPDNIGYFLSLGMVDTNFQPKPALAAWDEMFSLKLK